MGCASPLPPSRSRLSPSQRRRHRPIPHTTDLQLALTSASHSSTPLPLGQLAGKLYERLGARPEFAERDFSVVYEYLSEAREGVKAAKEERGEK